MGFFSKWFGSGGKRGPRVDLKKRFDFLNRSGQGSMSKVWRALDRKIGRQVALKILDKEKTAKFEARFPGIKKPSEGEICVVLRHKNVVQTYEHGVTTEGEPFLVMEWIEGSGLNFMVETRSPQLAARRLDWLAQMANGLDYIHVQRYLHRDICPRNVMVDKEGVPKFIDFGLALPYTPDFCKPGNRTGTPNYLAPEIIKRVRTDHRVDLFALGVTAYEMFTCQLPWEKAQSMQTLLSHMNSPGKDPRELVPDMDEATAAFLIKAIARDPRERFQSAGDFRNAVKALAQRV